MLGQDSVGTSRVGMLGSARPQARQTSMGTNPMMSTVTVAKMNCTCVTTAEIWMASIANLLATTIIEEQNEYAAMAIATCIVVGSASAPAWLVFTAGSAFPIV